MSQRRRVAPSVLLTLTLVLLPGLALAGGRHAAEPAGRESPFAFLLDLFARGWESLVHRTSPPFDQTVGQAGCGIDPNGGPCG